MAYTTNKWYYYNTNTTINKSKYRVFKHYYKDGDMVLQHNYIIKFLGWNWLVRILTLGVFGLGRQTYKEDVDLSSLYHIQYMKITKTFSNYGDAARHAKLLEQPIYGDEMCSKNYH